MTITEEQRDMVLDRIATMEAAARARDRILRTLDQSDDLDGETRRVLSQIRRDLEVGDDG